jgi:hypothetical protein
MAPVVTVLCILDSNSHGSLASSQSTHLACLYFMKFLCPTPSSEVSGSGSQDLLARYPKDMCQLTVQFPQHDKVPPG